MTDDLLEHVERLYERVGIPEPWRTICIRRFEEGRETYGPWNHLRLSKDELEDEFRQEVADCINFAVALKWSRAYHGTFANGRWCGTKDEEETDAVLDRDLIDAILSVCDNLDA